MSVMQPMTSGATNRASASEETRGGRTISAAEGLISPGLTPDSTAASGTCMALSRRHRALQLGGHGAAIVVVDRRGAEQVVARIRSADRKLADHAAGPRRHHHDALRQVDRLEDRVGDE